MHTSVHHFMIHLYIIVNLWYNTMYLKASRIAASAKYLNEFDVCNSVSNVRYIMLSDQVWAAASGQMFFSLSVAFGGILMFGSYNKFKNNVYGLMSIDTHSHLNHMISIIYLCT